MKNKEILAQAARFRKEKADPGRYGRYGTSRYVTGTEFWGRYGKKAILMEIKRRRVAGLIAPSAGKARKRTGYSLGGLSFRF